MRTETLKLRRAPTLLFGLATVLLGALAVTSTDAGSEASNTDGIVVTGIDMDGDGWATTDDCDDTDPLINPDATEIIADGIDQDCDGQELCYQDLDGDGYGFSSTTISSNLTCTDPGESTVSTDCDDANDDIHPSASEVVADGIDQDCDGQELCYQDLDGDGYGFSSTTISFDLNCSGPGESALSNDCDDANDDIHPSASEVVADGIDQDCDGQELCYQDLDGDGYGFSSTTISFDLNCSGAGESALNNDCDDTDDERNPGATEIPNNSIDDDCDPSTADSASTPTATPTPSPGPTTVPTPTATASISPSVTPEPTAGTRLLIWGDVDCSDGVSFADALPVLRFYAGLNPDTGDCPKPGEEIELLGASLHPWGDIDCSGDAGPIDALKVLLFKVGFEIAQAEGCPTAGSTVTAVY